MYVLRLVIFIIELEEGNTVLESVPLGFTDSHHVFTAKKTICHVTCHTKCHTPCLMKVLLCVSD